MTLSPVLARELAAARPRFNAEVAAARRARTGFDTDALAEAVRMRIDPLVVAVDTVAPDRVTAVVEAAFTATVTLVDHALAGERRALVDRAWTEAGVALAALVAERPEPVLALLTNAVLTLAATPGARPGEWVERMAALAPLASVDTLAGAGQVVAWRSGMAHYRAAAIAVADTLPEPLALAAIGAAGTWSGTRAALEGDRWWTPEAKPEGAVRIGGFAGFGGPFEEPPQVRAAPEGFFVRSGRRTWFLIADAWGATMHPASADEFDRAARASAAPTHVTDMPAEGLQAAIATDSIALTSPFSHFIEVQRWRP